MVSKNPYGFTLIELLIVVAIIAILAAIAVPNFLEAQTRAKVSRAKADMRSISTGLETYHIDNNTYPFQNPQYRALRALSGQPPVLESLTTPIAYMNSVSSYSDPFKANMLYAGNNLTPRPNNVPDDPYLLWVFQLYKYYARNENTAAIGGRKGDAKPKWYILASAGPDAAVENLNDPLTARKKDTPANRRFFYNKTIYDATNGTVSRGSVFRVGGSPVGPGVSFYHVAAATP